MNHPEVHEAPNIAVSRLQRRDLSRCAELECVLFPGDEPWSRQAFVAELKQGCYYLGAYEPSGQLVGYAGLGLMPHPEDAQAEVHTIGVDPAWQGYGIGRRLLRGLLDTVDKHRATTFLEVRTDNARAIALYERYDFAVIGTRKGYYQPSGADAYVMRRPIAAVSAAPDTDHRRHP